MEFRNLGMIEESDVSTFVNSYESKMVRSKSTEINYYIPFGNFRHISCAMENNERITPYLLLMVTDNGNMQALECYEDEDLCEIMRVPNKKESLF